MIAAARIMLTSAMMAATAAISPTRTGCASASSAPRRTADSIGSDRRSGSRTIGQTVNANTHSAKML